MYLEKWTKKPRNRFFKKVENLFKRKVFGIKYNLYNKLYFIENIIYKYINNKNIYNILNKYSYIDNVEVGRGNLGCVSYIETKNFSIDLGATFTCNCGIHEQYFYRDTKWGRKILLEVFNSREYTTTFHFKPLRVGLKILGSNRTIWSDNKDCVTISICKDSPIVSAKDSHISPPEFNKVTYDIGKLKSLNFSTCVGMKKSEIPTVLVREIIQNAEQEFRNSLDKISLYDLRSDEDA